MTKEEEQQKKKEKEIDATNTQIQEALSDSTKKRKAEDEIEIDLSKGVPLSKKQKRLLRRGKVTLEEINKKYNIDPASLAEFEKENKEKTEKVAVASSTEKTEESKSASPSKQAKKYGVWIGNLSFDTTKEDIIRFLTAKIEIIKPEDILRINMPFQKTDGKTIKNKGFAYVDFSSVEQMEKVIGLSENQLNGRNLLIKNSKNFDGRPKKEDSLISMSKNPPSRILFVGNLSYDITKELLEKHFQHCGEIVKIRMATFEDSGKCKGFAFIDFVDEDGPTKALTDKNCRKIAGRPIRMEFGEDRSKRQVKKRPISVENKFAKSRSTNNSKNGEINYKEPGPIPTNKDKEKKPSNNNKRNNSKAYKDNNDRLKSSVALANAQRESAAIVKSTGKKVKFD
ncbi:Nop13p SCDLUD_002961 [Saccharomycodes ludwigii]|uniref:Nop13p n=1 Tax=Saccharomycodes ludwigii TaxID=36035 RepID=UPI001E86DD08|nr:hypothetical protein SCDLUD_002961 [Saccharomycodes ludwigii]KAH3901466.1 hypothetical protein SCDLUD_002961 [Saccharomycodes ludwigii]